MRYKRKIIFHGDHVHVHDLHDHDHVHVHVHVHIHIEHTLFLALYGKLGGIVLLGRSCIPFLEPSSHGAGEPCGTASQHVPCRWVQCFHSLAQHLSCHSDQHKHVPCPC